MLHATRLFRPFVPLLLTLALTAAACSSAFGWETDADNMPVSPYWRGDAGNRDELRNLYENNRDEYNRLRDQYPDGPPASTPRPYSSPTPTTPPAPAPHYWNQFGPDGTMQTCTRGFGNVYCN